MDGEEKGFRQLLKGLQDYWQPQGAMEHELLEHLAALFWKRRRLLQAERAEILKVLVATEDDFFRAFFEVEMGPLPID